MSARLFLVAALGLVLAACGQPESTRADAPAPAPIDGEPCHTPTILSESIDLERIGAVGAYEISATPGALACSEPALGSVDCIVTGPGEVHAAAQNTVGFALEAGETGTFTVGPEGPRCFLNASGE